MYKQTEHFGQDNRSTTRQTTKHNNNIVTSWILYTLLLAFHYIKLLQRHLITKQTAVTDHALPTDNTRGGVAKLMKRSVLVTSSVANLRAGGFSATVAALTALSCSCSFPLLIGIVRVLAKNGGVFWSLQSEVVMAFGWRFGARSAGRTVAKERGSRGF